MATAVQIELQVDESGAIQGVKAFQSELNRTGTSAQSAGEKSRRAFDQQEKQIHRSHQAAQLLTRTFGVEMPSALERVIAKSPGVSTALSAAFNSAAVVAMVVAIAEAVRHSDELIGKWTNMKEAVQALFGDSNLKKLLKMEDAKKELEGVNDLLFQMNKAAALAGKQGFSQINEELVQSRKELDRFLEKFDLAIQDKFGRGTDRTKELQGAAAGAVDQGKIALTVATNKKVEELVRNHAKEIRQIELQGALIGKSEVEQIRMQLNADLKDLDLRRDLSEEERRKLRIAEEAEAAAKILDLRKQYNDQIQQLIGEEAGSALEGFAKIDHDARQKIDAIEKEFKDKFGSFSTLDPKDPQYQQLLDTIVNAQSQKLSAIGAVERAAIREQQKLLRDMSVRLGDELEAMFTGNVGQNILAQFRKLGYQMVAQMFLGMRGAAAGYEQGSARGVGLLGLISGILGIGGGMSAGGVPGGAAGGMGTPPFIPGNNFLPPGLTADGSMSSTSSASTNALGQIALGAAGGGGFFRLGGPGRALLGLGGLGASLAANKFGGNTAALGALIGVAGLGALYSGNSAAMMRAAPFAKFLGPVAGGLVGFGVGQSTGSKTFGALSGAGTGALVGFMAAGPIGAAIGGLVGLVGGIFGGIFGGRSKRREALKLEGAALQEIIDTLNAYKGFQLDYASALKQLDEIKANYFPQFDKLGNTGRKMWQRDTLPRFDDALREINMFEAERNRRSTINFGLPQFHSGGLVGGPNEIVAKLQRGEFVMNPEATAKNRQQLERMNNGEDSGSGVVNHFHIDALDGRSVERWLSNGGARMISRAQRRNRFEGGE